MRALGRCAWLGITSLGDVTRSDRALARRRERAIAAVSYTCTMQLQLCTQLDGRPQLTAPVTARMQSHDTVT